MINYLALLIALVVSGVSAYYSILGLTAIFAAAYYPVVIMGVALELGKLVTTSWLYRNWRTCPFLLKSYLTSAVFILMLISSMGVFGFLSKAHIEQNLSLTTGQADSLAIIDQKISSEKDRIKDLDVQIAQIDAALSKMTERGQAASSLQAADRQRKTRETLVTRKDQHAKNISQYSEERIKIQSNLKRIEAEVGPIKYIAALVYDESGSRLEDNLERAVRAVIILLVLVFDPLAVVLLLAANHGLNERNRFTIPEKHDILKIEDENI